MSMFDLHERKKHTHVLVRISAHVHAVTCRMSVVSFFYIHKAWLTCGGRSVTTNCMARQCWPIGQIFGE